MSNKQSRFLKQQKIIVGVGGALILIVILVLAFILLKDNTTGGGFVEGEHYFLLEDPKRMRTKTIEVREFFSYACVHCYNLDDDLADWVETQGDKINFVRNPVIANELWRTFGRAYYTMEALDILEEGHSRLFRELHVGRRNLNSGKKISDALSKDDNDSAAFLKMFNSPRITRKIDQADQLARRYKIATVPNLVVNGKYLIRSNSSVGLSRMLDVVDYLIELESAPEEILSEELSPEESGPEESGPEEPVPSES